MPATPTFWRSLENVNATTTGNQFAPDAVQLTNGSLVFGWSSDFIIGANDENDESQLSGGSIVWQGLLPNGARPGTFPAIPDAGGLDAGQFATQGEFNPTDGTDERQEFNFDMLALPSGQLAMSYVSNSNSTIGDTELRVVFASSDLGSFNEFTYIDRQPSGSGGQASIVNTELATIGTDLALVYTVANPQGGFGDDYNHVLVRVDPQSGQVVRTTPIFANSDVAGTYSNDLTTATLSNGSLVLAFSDNNVAPEDDLLGITLLSPSGDLIAGANAALGSTNDVHQNPAVAALANGDFVVAWQTEASAFSGDFEVVHRVFNAGGEPVTPILGLGPSATSLGDQTGVSVAGLADGGYVLSWYDANTSDLHGRRFDDNGSAVGNEFDIDTDVGSTFFKVSDALALDDGRVVFSWEDDDGSEISSAIYDPRDMVNATPAAGQTFVGTIGNDTITLSAAGQEGYGWQGRDILNVSSSGVVAYGGSGDDVYRVSAAQVGLFELPGEGYDRMELSVGGQFVRDNIEQGVLTAAAGGLSSGTSDGVLIGNGAQSNLLSGNEFDNFISVGGGSNLAYGGGGDDQILGGALADLLSGQAGNDALIGGGGSDIMLGNSGNDTLDGAAGQDALYGDFGNDAFRIGAVAFGEQDTIFDFGAENQIGGATGNGSTGRAHDVISLQAFNYGSLGGDVEANEFVVGTSGQGPTQANAQLIFETDTGRLLYDSDGTGSGAAFHILNVRFYDGTLTVDDFDIV